MINLPPIQALLGESSANSVLNRIRQLSKEENEHIQWLQSLVAYRVISNKLYNTTCCIILHILEQNNLVIDNIQHDNEKTVIYTVKNGSVSLWYVSEDHVTMWKCRDTTPTYVSYEHGQWVYSDTEFVEPQPVLVEKPSVNLSQYVAPIILSIIGFVAIGIAIGCVICEYS